MFSAPHDLQATPAETRPLATKIRHRLLFRDTLTFLTLTAFTVVLFSATLFLFRSFAAHQHDLAVRWSERARIELAQGHPDRAVTSLRTALTYAPGERSYELLLAQALGDAGHTDEAYTYFTGLWDRTPGDGLINLRLARLAAIKGDRGEAVNFYRASIYGTWTGDAIVRRQQARLELAQYFIAQKQFDPARDELRIAGGNAGQNPELDRRISQLLLSAGDPREALDFDLKALTAQPNDAATAVAAAGLSNRLDDVPQTLRLSEQALHLLGNTRPQTPATADAMHAMRTLQSNLERLQQLDPAASLPSAERAQRILFAASLARLRLATCLAAMGPTTPTTTLASLTGQWSALQPSLTPRTLSRQHDAQDAAIHLIDATEIATGAACAPPTGDDALLLRLGRQHAQTNATAAPQL